ncbi:hypothetical protein K432DRAFT_184766 [Lepidopterella palustris CBS 459.81]|uniref:Uncharacterized protein n=1 Tax=Lepidopterella palustris CBS 459.81 TaxID=1314670 RepID=A0A8E2JI12_9PEZI|nr:hypothetical protein K432DRAFT_184766 [Lepidopterella palustris CBS 459.81]
MRSLYQGRAAYSFGSVEHHQPTPQHRHSFQDLDRNSSTPPLIDPATITQWPEGLRCVSKIASQNPHFKGAIRKLMADQESHERAWWRGRQILMKEQAAKKGHIGNHVPTWSSAAGSNEATSEAVEADEVELKEYDKKVYRASREMVNVMSLELKRLGVPFFGMKPELILPSGTEEPAVQQKPSVRPGTASGPKITEEEMLGLQRRMLGYLEDMYRER